MGFHLDVTVDKEYIDHNHAGEPFYHEKVQITGNGVCDTICIQQNGQTIGMSVWQFKDLMDQISKTSFWHYARLNKIGELE